MTNYNVYDFRNENGGIVKAWTNHVSIEDQALEQVKNISKLPFLYSHVSVMPDVHAGIGCTVGSVIATKRAIVPSFVGVDIGCGMIAYMTTLKAKDLPDNLKPLRLEIEKAVPHGRTQGRDKGSWENPPDDVLREWKHLEEDGFKELCEKYTHLTKANHVKHLCSLGTGNHFIEICLDLEQNVWVMLHSGSRGIGGAIGRTFIELAKKEMEKWFIHLPDKDLAYFPHGSEYFDDYWKAMMWAQEYAKTNRKLMMQTVLKTLANHDGIPAFSVGKIAVNCHHNFCAKENHFGENVFVTRKGAVRARKDDYCIIPGSMGARSFICKGLGNPDSFMSCSHGAGRVMSRNKAKQIISLDDHIKATEGVECRKDEDVVDESPAAYKNIEDVMKSQSDLVEIVYELKQILCVKG